MQALVRRLTGSRLGLACMAGALVLIIALAQSPLLKGSAPAGHSATAPAAGQQTSAAPASAAPATAASPVASASPAASGAFLPAYQDPQADPAPNGVATLLGLGLKLGIVVALIYATVWILRFLNARTARTFAGHGAMTVLESTRLGPNRDVYLLQVADKVLVVAATGSSMNLLTEVTDSNSLEVVRNRPEPSLPSPEPFLNYLRNVSQKLTGRQEPAPADAFPATDWAALSAQADAAEAPAAEPQRRPADLLQRIEQSKKLIRERTLAIQGSSASGGFEAAAE